MALRLRDTQQQYAITQKTNVTKRYLGRCVSAVATNHSSRLGRSYGGYWSGRVRSMEQICTGLIHVQRQQRFRERCSEGANAAEYPPPLKWGRSDRLDWPLGCSFLLLRFCQSRLAINTPRSSTLTCSSCFMSSSLDVNAYFLVCLHIVSSFLLLASLQADCSLMRPVGYSSLTFGASFIEHRNVRSHSMAKRMVVTPPQSLLYRLQLQRE
jgi:hypothetical protein